MTQAERHRIEQARNAYHATKRGHGDARREFAKAIRDPYETRGSVRELTEVAKVSKPTVYTMVKLARGGETTGGGPA